LATSIRSWWPSHLSCAVGASFKWGPAGLAASAAPRCSSSAHRRSDRRDGERLVTPARRVRDAKPARVVKAGVVPEQHGLGNNRTPDACAKAAGVDVRASPWPTCRPIRSTLDPRGRVSWRKQRGFEDAEAASASTDCDRDGDSSRNEACRRSSQPDCCPSNAPAAQRSAARAHRRRLRRLSEDAQPRLNGNVSGTVLLLCLFLVVSTITSLSL
jgi:hypothetical protein